MFPSLRSDAHWVYDDPSGLPEAPFTVSLPEPFRGTKPFGIVISIGDFSFGNGKLRVRARIPHASRARITTASADVKLRGRLAFLETKTAAGDLALSGEVERDATVKTVSGDVRIERVGGDLKLTSVSGDATVRSIGGSVEAKTVSGDVRLESVREGRVTLQSVSRSE